MSPELSPRVEGNARPPILLGKLNSPPDELVSQLETAGISSEGRVMVGQAIERIQHALGYLCDTSNVFFTGEGEILVKGTHPDNPPFNFTEVVGLDLK